MNNKKAVFSTLFCIFIAALFILGCNNHLLKPQQDEPHLLVRIVNSTGARNATTTGEWQISAWIENRDGTESHHQNVTSASGSKVSITFDDLVIGSQINIHLELTKIDDTQTKFTGESGWTTIKEGVNVIDIVLRDDNGFSHAQIPVIEEISSTIETYTSNPQPVTTTLKAVASVTDGGALTYQWYSSDSPTTDSGTAIDGATSATYDARVEAGKTKYFYCVVTNTNNNVNGNKTASATSNIATVASIEGTLTRITAHYTGTHELVNEDITYSNIEIVQEYAIPNAEPQEISVVASSVSTQYTIELQYNNDAIGNVPATVTHKTNPQITADFTIPVKYQLDVNKLTLNGSNSVEQNGSLSLTATYADTYTKYDGGSGSEYNVKNNVTVTWTGATPQSDAWTATADTTTTGQKTATVTISSTDRDWCVTTNGITASHRYEVTAAVPSYSIGDEYEDDSGTSIGYVFEVNDSYIKIVEKNEGWQYYWCGASTNINNWSDLINISDGEEMYNAVKNQPTGDKSIFTYANNKNTSGESGWYIPTKEELFDIFKMNETYDVLNISGAYWSSSLESITGGYTAYYVQGTGESDSDLGTNYIDEASNSVVAVKKIKL